MVKNGSLQPTGGKGLGPEAVNELELKQPLETMQAKPDPKGCGEPLTQCQQAPTANAFYEEKNSCLSHCG